MASTAKITDTQDWRLSLVIYPDALLMPAFIGITAENLRMPEGTDAIWHPDSSWYGPWSRFRDGTPPFMRAAMEDTIARLLRQYEPLTLPFGEGKR